MTLETKAAFARRLGVNKSTVTRAAQAGRLVMQGEMVDVAQSLARWQGTRGGRLDVAERHAAQRGRGVSVGVMPAPGAEKATAGRFGGLAGLVAGNEPAQLDEDGEGEDDDGASRTQYKAMRMFFENEAIKLEMALRRGQRYPLDAVKREASGLGATLRASVERLIDHTAPRLAAEQRPEARLSLLHAEVAALSRAMRQEFVQALRRLRQPQGVKS